VCALAAVVLAHVIMRLEVKTVQNTAFSWIPFLTVFLQAETCLRGELQKAFGVAAVPFVSRADTQFTLLELTVFFLMCI
jgi:hypothetical protein